MIGAIIGFWLIYALISIFAKHKTGLIITLIIGIISGIGSLTARGDFTTLLGTILGAFLVYFIIPIQVKSEQKELRKQNKNNSKNITNINYHECKRCGMLIFDDEEICSNCGNFNTEYKNKQYCINSDIDDVKKFNTTLLSKDEIVQIENDIIGDSELKITSEEKLQLEKLFNRSFKYVLFPQPELINNKKSIVYCFSPFAPNLGEVCSFVYLARIGVKKQRWFALEWSYDSTMVVCEWIFENNKEIAHVNYGVLISDVTDMAKGIYRRFLDKIKDILNDK